MSLSSTRRAGVVPIATLLLLTLGCGGNSANSKLPAVKLQLVISNLSLPLGLEQPNDGTNRLFVVQQGGAIRIIENGALLPLAFLDISSKVTSKDEMGLLGLAFHPSFRLNRERILLTVYQVGNFTNHKAGQLAFGPDGFLYFGLGDGGNGGDPFGNGQNTQTLLGKMLRIDVDATSPGLQYRLPPDNPFIAGGGLPEVWAFGFRNPWRFSFDRSSGRLFVADVGQASFEEIDIVQKGGNYGWNIMEGLHCFNPPSGCNMTGITLPITEYSHAEGVAVIGGFVYHGSAIPGLQGFYIFGDLKGQTWALREVTPTTWQRTPLLATGLSISSFGQDQSGELYVADYNGNVFRLQPQ